ncbi:uncharacterized protein MYCFIDRAFT_170795 [Pseudocercospora fijiensis CIRAD86]|uniref:Uncharacterized protein n=1 Tax=Pseudocercospora fijiensis (strain CIRAD86) TaxID=383855 RepID=N1Q8V7_PSEFD|nr:uncharacterized protein MYCFIDRAFT_170795 [Pseudocercospora fijiensis CIRAD86]EME89325.1 hypothetical protein MYCFIDRAFT_170795 [Pseudocercospora fijiensis CIRAD86]
MSIVESRTPAFCGSWMDISTRQWSAPVPREIPFQSAPGHGDLTRTRIVRAARLLIRCLAEAEEQARAPCGPTLIKLPRAFHVFCWDSLSWTILDFMVRNKSEISDSTGRWDPLSRRCVQTLYSERGCPAAAGSTPVIIRNRAGERQSPTSTRLFCGE